MATETQIQELTAALSNLSTNVALSDAINSTSSVSDGVAATPLAVKTAKEEAIAATNSNLTALNAAVVHKSGAETIAGTKTFTGLPVIQKTDNSNVTLSLQQTGVTKGTTPEKSVYWGISFADSTGTGVTQPVQTAGVLQTVYNTSGQIKTFIRAMTPVANSGTYAQITAVANADGTFHGEAPTPAASSNTNHIATTEWVRGKGVLVESWHSGASWYRKYSDGWIEQGGTTQNVNHDSTVMVSCHTSFATTNYNIVVTQKSSENKTDSTGMVLVYPSNTSSWRLHNGDNVSAPFMWYACGY